MYTITDEEMNDLIQKYYGTSCDKNNIPIFDLKTLVECGLSFLFAKQHLHGNILTECSEEFSIYQEHKCVVEKKIEKKHKSSFLEISNIQKLDEPPDTLKFCWTGVNLAILTSSFILQGYFKTDLLFQKKFSEAGALTATSDKICIGLLDGTVIHFDPITQNELSTQHHTDIITSMYLENNVVLTSSIDGSIFYKKNIQINSSGVIDVKYINDEKFLCSCFDNSLALYNEGNIKSFVGHKERINSLSFNNFGISSSNDGCVGYLFNDQVFETEFLDISHHKRISVHQFLGYGKDTIILYDVNKNLKIWKEVVQTLNLDTVDHLIAYSCNKNLILKDIRSNEKMSIQLKENITDLEFSQSGNLLLINTEESPLLFEMRYV